MMGLFGVRGRGLLVVAAALVAGVTVAVAQPVDLRAEGHDLRIDLVWRAPAEAGDDAAFNLYRAAAPDGPFTKLNAEPYRLTVYSDWLGANGQTRHYRVALVGPDGAEREPSATVAATTRAMSRDELLTSVQQATFRYFWDFGHPVSGLAREGLRHPRDTCTSGGTGFGLMTLMVGAERGFAPREQVAQRVLKIVRFLDETTPRYHGVWAHWIHGATGETIPFAGPQDNGGDIVETALLVQGLLTVAEYFDRPAPVEREIRERVERMWRGVEWSWHLGPDPGNRQLIWHWSPDHGFRKNHRIGGHFNECMIAYILAIASPTHAIPPECYYEGWVRDPAEYANGKTFHGIRQPVGWDRGGPLFFTQYSFVGLDPRAVTDRFCNYFENNRAISRIHQAYCIENPHDYAGYGERAWGLTASFSVEGYRAHEPRGDNDNGTLTPTAAICAMPYVPEASLAALEHYYRDWGHRLWGPFGFWDAFNPEHDWVSDTVLAIDQGPMAPMIENYRTQLCWRTFLRNQDLLAGLRKAGLLDASYVAADGSEKAHGGEHAAE